MQPAEELEYLKTPRAVRERAQAVFDWISGDRSSYFTLDLSGMSALAQRVTALAVGSYGGFERVPFHSRWRHLDADGGARSRTLAAAVGGASTVERLRTECDLVITSVLLDAGAGAQWRYHSADGRSWSRSEGLAIASYDAFLVGSWSGADTATPAAHAARLRRVTAREVELSFQVDAQNPLVASEGRAALLRRLGEVVEANPRLFPGDVPRPGNLAVYLLQEAEKPLTARAIFDAVLAAFTPIWPSRLTLAGQPLGDVWRHPDLGLIPFHKLSQWLSYSLCETFERCAVPVHGVEELTGLAEYRNGGLFLDAGMLLPRDPALLAQAHAVDSAIVVEWRAVTLALLERVADAIRTQLTLSAAQLPLARVLEGGTWALGRQLAAERRDGGAPPLQIISDGTVF
jgi:Protein of unknown function (DUF1688)